MVHCAVHVFPVPPALLFSVLFSSHCFAGSTPYEPVLSLPSPLLPSPLPLLHSCFFVVFFLFSSPEFSPLCVSSFLAKHMLRSRAHVAGASNSASREPHEELKYPGRVPQKCWRDKLTAKWGFRHRSDPNSALAHSTCGSAGHWVGVIAAAVWGACRLPTYQEQATSRGRAPSADRPSNCHPHSHHRDARLSY